MDRSISLELSVEMTISQNPYSRVNKLLISGMGLWPHQTKFYKYLITRLSIIIIISQLVPQAIGTVKIWGDMGTVLQSFSAIIIVFAALILLANCIYNMNNIEQLFSKMKKDLNSWTSGPEVKILDEHAKNSHKFTMLFTILIFMTMVDYLALPLMPIILDLITPLNESRPRKGALVAEYYIDGEKYFYSIYLHNFISVLVCVVSLVGSDTMLMVFILHACGQLEVLGNRLKNLITLDDSDSNVNEVTLQRKLRQEIKFCSKKHHMIMRFVHDISKSFSSVYFLILGLNMIVMSVSGVQVVLKLDEPREAATFLTFTLGQIVHLFFLSVPCQQLIDNSLRLTDHIYNGYWYNLSSGLRKLLLLIMMRSSKPCVFAVGKLYVLSMQNFAMVVRTSMSYFTVLLSVR